MRPGLRSAAALAGALALLGPATQATADDGPNPSAHVRLLSRAGHGAAVVSALGGNLDAAAAVNHMSSTRLARILKSDSTAWLGKDGQMFYKEAAPALGQAGATTQIAAATLPADQTFALHSLPGSTHKIFLDFDGAYVGGTFWNTSSLAMESRFYTGFTLDGDPTTFSSAELAYIQQVWRIVAEKYSPFEVDVTTEDPGADGYNRSSSADQTYGDHVLISDDPGAVKTACGGGCSGIALVNTFASTDPGTLEPAWVFSSQTLGSPVLTAHTVAHEVGHTFGLHHDGDSTHEYSSGHANWFPIMGSSINAVGQFSFGEYANANNHEDDLAIIAANGAPLRKDDRSDGMLLAEPLATGTLVDGVISTRADQDVFVVNHACTTNLTARATGIGAGASLDMSVTVLDSAGNQVGFDDPASGQNILSTAYTPTGMNASATVASAPSGAYYVRIDGVAKGDPVTNGYSDYGSVGEYQLAVSNCDGTMPASTMPAPAGEVDSPATPTTPVVGVPSPPRVRLASSGRRGHPVTAVARWSPPASNGGAAIVGYRVQAERLGRAGRTVGVVSSALVSSGTHALTMRLRHGRYRFQVVAYNRAGASPLSTPSRVVLAR